MLSFGVLKYYFALRKRRDDEEGEERTRMDAYKRKLCDRIAKHGNKSGDGPNKEEGGEGPVDDFVFEHFGDAGEASRGWDAEENGMAFVDEFFFGDDTVDLGVNVYEDVKKILLEERKDEGEKKEDERERAKTRGGGIDGASKQCLSALLLNIVSSIVPSGGGLDEKGLKGSAAGGRGGGGGGSNEITGVGYMRRRKKREEDLNEIRSLEQAVTQIGKDGGEKEKMDIKNDKKSLPDSSVVVLPERMVMSAAPFDLDMSVDDSPSAVMSPTSSPTSTSSFLPIQYISSSFQPLPLLTPPYDNSASKSLLSKSSPALPTVNSQSFSFNFSSFTSTTSYLSSPSPPDGDGGETLNNPGKSGVPVAPLTLLPFVLLSFIHLSDKDILQCHSEAEIKNVFVQRCGKYNVHEILLKALELYIQIHEIAACVDEKKMGEEKEEEGLTKQNPNKDLAKQLLTII
jgi:hypothetical protein